MDNDMAALKALPSAYWYSSHFPLALSSSPKRILLDSCVRNPGTTRKEGEKRNILRGIWKWISGLIFVA
jgi:hypothetical protein